MIRCPACGSENNPNVRWCTACGSKLDLTKEELDQFLSVSIKKERETHTETRIRQVLAFAIFAFVVALGAFIFTRTPVRGRTDIAYPYGNPDIDAKEFKESDVYPTESLEPWKLHTEVKLAREDIWDRPVLLVKSTTD